MNLPSQEAVNPKHNPVISAARHSTPKILFITARADLGGGQEILFRLLQQLTVDIDAYVACPREEPYWSRYSNLLGEDRLFEIPHRSLSIQYFRELQDKARQHGIQLVHSHGFGAGIYSRSLAFLNRIPVVHTYHGLTFRLRNPLSLIIRLVTEGIFGGFSAALITVSDSEKLHVSKWLPFHKRKLLTIWNGLPASPSSSTQQGRDVNPRRRILWLGRMVEQKHPEQMVEVARHLTKMKPGTDFEVDMVGDGQLFDKVKRLVEAAGLSNVIHLHGRSSNPNAYFASAAVFISTSRWEGLPTVVLEAMQHGALVVASCVRGNVDLVEHGKTGFLFDPRNPDQAAALIAKALDQSQENQKICASAQDRVADEFSVFAFSQRHLVLYRNLLGTPGR